MHYEGHERREVFVNIGLFFLRDLRVLHGSFFKFRFCQLRNRKHEQIIRC